MSKNVVETEGPQITSQYDAYALRVGLARLYARMRLHTRTHAHTDQYVILLFHSNNSFRECATVLRYTYIGLLFEIAKACHISHGHSALVSETSAKFRRDVPA
jgi:hypothetical protein